MLAQPAPEVVEGRRRVAIEDDLGAEADDPAGTEVEQRALAGRELAGGQQRRDAPAGSTAPIAGL